MRNCIKNYITNVLYDILSQLVSCYFQIFVCAAIINMIVCWVFNSHAANKIEIASTLIFRKEQNRPPKEIVMYRKIVFQIWLLHVVKLNPLPQ